MNKDSIIKASGLTKYYGDFLAVDHVNFEVEKGDVFGFLGPNGAGKTTMINILTGLARADTGSLRIAGIDIGKNTTIIPINVGYIPVSCRTSHQQIQIPVIIIITPRY